MRSEDLKQKRAAVHASLEALDTKMVSEKRTTMTDDENVQFDRMFAEMTALDRSIKLAETVERNEKKDLDFKQDEPLGAKEEAAKARTAIGNYLKYGMAALSAEDRTILAATKLVQGMQRNTQSSVTAAQGAEMVKKEYMSEFEKYLIDDRGVMNVARIIPTVTGADLPWPSVDDTGNEGELLAEGATTSQLRIPTGGFTLKAYNFSSKAIIVPLQLVQDDGYGFVNEIPELAGGRINRIANRLMTTGTGSGQPEGITVGSTDSTVTVPVNTITRGKLLDLIHSVKTAYRGGGKGKLMFNDDTLAKIIKLSIGSGDDRPLWTPGMASGPPSMIEGYAYEVNDYMPDLGTAANRAIVFGDLSKYYVRMVKDFEIKRADELHIAEYSVGFYGFARLDGRVANSDAIKYLSVSGS